eukprot:sb/3475533/
MILGCCYQGLSPGVLEPAHAVLYLAPADGNGSAPALFEIQLRASGRTIFQTILNQNNTTGKTKKIIFIGISHHFLLTLQNSQEEMIRYRNGNELFSLSRCVILIQNCLKNRSTTGPKLYLKQGRS